MVEGHHRCHSTRSPPELIRKYSGAPRAAPTPTVAIGYTREYSAQTAAAALRARLRARTTVLRDGCAEEIPDVRAAALGHHAPAPFPHFAGGEILE
jgi:hypothetical protein